MFHTLLILVQKQCHELFTFIDENMDPYDLVFVREFCQAGLKDTAGVRLSCSFYSLAQHGWIIIGVDGQVDKPALFEALPTLESYFHTPLKVLNVPQGLLLQPVEVLEFDVE